MSMNSLNFPVLTFFAVILLGLLVLATVWRRVPQDHHGSKDELERLGATLAAQEERLRSELARAARADALAEDRKLEIDRLNGDLSTLRARMDSDRDELQVALSAKSALESKAQGDSELIASKMLEIQTLMHEIALLRARMDADREELQVALSAKSALESKAQGDSELIANKMLEIQTQMHDIALLRARLEEEQKAKQAFTNTVARLETQMDAAKRSADEKITLLTSVREDMQAKFKQLADDALKSQGETFSKANIERLDATLTPLKEHVGHFEKELREVHQETVKDRERLKAEINQLSKRSEEISNEAVNLTRALKGDHQQQGAWGEMILETILERSGLREGEEYETQAHRVDADGARLKPDVVVRIPGNKTLVIDSKVSLVAYAEAVNASDPAALSLARKRHVASIRSHINGLSMKGYQRAEGSTVDYVIMFIPIEGAFSEALREDGALTEYALERHITIATPTTLMMALRTVSHVWAVERRNSNAELIAKRAGLLYDKVAGFVLNMEKVGKGLGSAHTAYEGAIGQLTRGPGNVLGQIGMLKTLGAKTSKEIALDFDAETILMIDKKDIEMEAVVANT